MIMAEFAALDNIEQLTGMAENLTAFVQQAAAKGPPRTRWKKKPGNEC